VFFADPRRSHRVTVPSTIGHVVFDRTVIEIFEAIVGRLTVAMESVQSVGWTDKRFHN